VNPIRPTGPFVPQPANTGADAARLAAQRAFFDQAMGRAAPAARPQATAVVQAVQAPAPSIQAPRTAAVEASSEAPAKPLRPGSLLDIRV